MKRLLVVLGSFLLVSLVISAHTARAGDSKVTGYAAIYGTYLNYGGSDIKDHGYSVTGYFSLDYNKIHNLQLGFEQTHINYKKGLSDLDQQDYTLAYTNTNGIVKNHAFTVGVHYINTDDDLTDDGFTLFFDGTHFSYQTKAPYLFNWSGGIGVYYSHYDNTVNFDVIQLNPHVSFRLYASPSFGGLYTDLVGYYINVSDFRKVGVTNNDYYSMDAALRYYYKNLELKAGGWLGKQVFAVKNGGFVVYNLSEEYKGGAYGEIAYNFKSLRIAFNVTYNRYKEMYSGGDVDQMVETISIGYRF